MASKRPRVRPHRNNKAELCSKKTKKIDRIDPQCLKKRSMPIRVRSSPDSGSIPKLPSPNTLHQPKIVIKNDKDGSSPRKSHATVNHSSIPVRVHGADGNKTRNAHSLTNARTYKFDRREKSKYQPWIPVRVHGPRPHKPQAAALQPASNAEDSNLKNLGQTFVLYCDLDGGSMISSVHFFYCMKC